MQKYNIAFVKIYIIFASAKQRGVRVVEGATLER
jgi:hypothetical protein